MGKHVDVNPRFKSGILNDKSKLQRSLIIIAVGFNPRLNAATKIGAASGFVVLNNYYGRAIR